MGYWIIPRKRLILAPKKGDFYPELPSEREMSERVLVGLWIIQRKAPPQLQDDSYPELPPESSIIQSLVNFDRYNSKENANFILKSNVSPKSGRVTRRLVRQETDGISAYHLTPLVKSETYPEVPTEKEVGSSFAGTSGGKSGRKHCDFSSNLTRKRKVSPHVDMATVFSPQRTGLLSNAVLFEAKMQSKCHYLSQT